ncbi:MAG: isochorismatase family protein [Acidimicrobiales bacterium]
MAGAEPNAPDHEPVRPGPDGDRSGRDRYGPGRALIVVDMQNDFASPDGSLFVTGGDRIVGRVNDEIAAARTSGAVVVFTQDWHPAVTPHFQPEGTWPVHCVGGSWGAELVDGLDPGADAVVRKGANGEDGYSAFTMRHPTTGEEVPTGLAGLLRDRRVTGVVVVGLAADVCVAATAIDAAGAGFAATVLWDATRPVFTDDGTDRRVMGELAGAGVTVQGREG